jgi:two-component system LytT family response regulator
LLTPVLNARFLRYEKKYAAPLPFKHMAMAGKFPIRETDKTTYAEQSSIEALEAGRAYTTVHFTSRPSKIISGSLNRHQELLSPKNFCRVHRSWLVNMDEIGGFDNFHFLIMKSGRLVPLSRLGRKALTQAGFFL